MSAKLLCLAVCTVLCVSGHIGQTGDNESHWHNGRVQTESGPVQGYVRAAEGGAAYRSFRGIPYARQPVGELRFRELEPVEPWSEVLEAREEGPACPQHTLVYGGMMKTQGMSEACLHLNVHVPITRLKPTDHSAGGYDETLQTDQESTRAPPPPPPPLPVLVFIHGGGFGYGSGDADLYGPEYLVTKDVIVLTFNYRVAALGFLSLDSAALPGNLGMRDMVHALRWVQRNIAAFGGDPDNVTVGGQSAGAVAAHLLTLSPTARGLFHRAILMSGVAIRSWITTSPINAKRQATSFIQKLNITDTDPVKILNKLQELDLDSIMSVTKEMQDQDGLTTFVPVVESRFDGVEPFLDEDPEVMIEEARALDVPLIIGYTDKECHTFAQRFKEINLMQIAQALPVVIVPAGLIYTSTQAQLAVEIEMIKNRYFGGVINNDSLIDFIDYCTDSYFIYPAMKLSQMLSSRISSPVYQYQFSYDGENDVVKEAVSGNFSGAGHIEDLVHMFKVNSYDRNIIEGSLDEWIKDWVTVMFTNYMKTSNPTPEFSEDQSLDWEAFDNTAQLILNINETISVQTPAYENMIAFFDDLYASNINSDVAPASFFNSDDAQTTTGPGRCISTGNTELVDNAESQGRRSEEIDSLPNEDKSKEIETHLPAVHLQRHSDIK